MTVKTRFNFTDEEVRTIRAAIGRGGKATRKECVVFIDRAVRTALAAAPEPKRRQPKREKGEGMPVPDADHPQAENARIRGIFTAQRRLEGRA